MRSAILGFHIWAPVGWCGLIINSDFQDEKFRSVATVQILEAYVRSPWAKFLNVAGLSLSELKTIINGTLSIFEAESGICRKAFQYLEIGLQTAMNHMKAGALLCMIGLDALLIAQNGDRFSKRLCRLLGANTRVFPRDYAGRWPAYTVSDVASDLYQLRNQIAHGDRIRAPYLIKSEFKFDPAASPWFTTENRTWQSILCEASFFLLAAALRVVILDGRLALLENQKTWKKWLDE